MQAAVQHMLTASKDLRSQAASKWLEASVTQALSLKLVMAICNPGEIRVLQHLSMADGQTIAGPPSIDMHAFLASAPVASRASLCPYCLSRPAKWLSLEALLVNLEGLVCAAIQSVL